MSSDRRHIWPLSLLIFVTSDLHHFWPSSLLTFMSSDLRHIWPSSLLTFITSDLLCSVMPAVGRAKHLFNAVGLSNGTAAPAAVAPPGGQAGQRDGDGSSADEGSVVSTVSQRRTCSACGKAGEWRRSKATLRGRTGQGAYRSPKTLSGMVSYFVIWGKKLFFGGEIILFWEKFV